MKQQGEVAVVGLRWGALTEIRNLWEPPSLRRRALSFVGFGLIASVSGLALLVADNDSDPRRAFEFAPVQTPSVVAASAKPSAEVPLVHAILVHESGDSDSIPREITKRENLKSCPGYGAENRCGSGAASNSGIAAPVSSPSKPETAPVSSPPALTIVPTVDVENTPVVGINAAPSTDAGPAVVEAPAPEVSVAKERKTSRQQSGHRHAYQQSSRRGRYAKQHFWPFW